MYEENEWQENSSIYSIKNVFTDTPFDPNQLTNDIELWTNGMAGDNLKTPIISDININSYQHSSLPLEITGPMRKIKASIKKEFINSITIYIPLGPIVCTNLIDQSIIEGWFTQNDIMYDYIDGNTTLTKIVFYQKP